jgi:sialate O-acetylesterase
VWGKAIIENNEVLVWSDDIPHPKYLRYAWADNPDFANLFNREGLPASPFRIENIDPTSGF